MTACRWTRWATSFSSRLVCGRASAGGAVAESSTVAYLEGFIASLERLPVNRTDGLGTPPIAARVANS